MLIQCLLLSILVSLIIAADSRLAFYESLIQQLPEPLAIKFANYGPQSLILRDVQREVREYPALNDLQGPEDLLRFFEYLAAKKLYSEGIYPDAVILWARHFGLQELLDRAQHFKGSGELEDNE